MNTACAVDYSLRVHQAEEADRDEYSEAVEARAAEMMLPGGEFDPLETDHLTEALGEAPADQWALLAKLMRAKDAAKVLAQLEAMTRGYWKPIAESKAEDYMFSERLA